MVLDYAQLKTLLVDQFKLVSFWNKKNKPISFTIATGSCVKYL